MPGIFDDILGPSVAEAPAVSTAPAPRRRHRAAMDEVASVTPPDSFDPLNALTPRPHIPAPVADDYAPEPFEVKPFEPKPDEPGILGTIGDIFDRPGNATRGLLAGRLDPLKGLIPFGESMGIYDPKKNHVSGRDVLNSWGLKNDEKDGFLSAGGIGGLALELGADPLNFLPGFMGLKAATKAGHAAEIVGSHLGDVDKAVNAAKYGARTLAEKIAAEEQAGKVLDEASVLAEKAKIPQAKTDLFGDLLDTGGKQLPDADLVQRIAGRDDAVGRAAKELIDGGASSFRTLPEAGDRVRAGQEALLSVGGEFDPFGLTRIGGRYNPINHLPEIPGLTAPLHLPQKTLIEGADAAQKLQDIGRGIGDLPGIRQAKALFSKVPGAPAASKDALEQFAKDSRTDMRAGGAAAEDSARALNEELKSIGDVNVPDAPEGLREANIDLHAHVDPNEDPMDWLLDKATPSPLREPEFSAKAQAIMDEEANPTKLPIGWEQTKFPDVAPGAPKKNVLEGSRFTPLEDVTGRPQYEDFELPKKGQTVRFNPRNALSNPAGLRKTISGRIAQVFDFQGQTIAQLDNGFNVPLESVARPAANVRADFNDALDMFERERQWKGKTPIEIKRLKDRARDARSALEQSTETGDLLGMQRNAALKSDRNDILTSLGMKDTGELEQAQALPKVLERALQKGHTPNLKTVDYLDLESGAVGVGDKLKLAGDTFTLKHVDPETGLVRLQDGIPIDVPMNRIPMDKGAPIEHAASDAELAQRAQSFDPLNELTASASTEAPRIASGTDVGGAGAVNYSKLNKAADILAGTESKLGVKPFERPEFDPLNTLHEPQAAQREEFYDSGRLHGLMGKHAGGKYVTKESVEASENGIRQMQQEIQDAAANGAQLTMVVDGGKEIPVKKFHNGQFIDDKGQRWGFNAVVSSANRGDGLRVTFPESVADLGKSQIPDVVNDVLTKEPRAPMSIGEASNPSPTLRDFAQGRTEAAGRLAEEAERTRIKALQDAGATTTGELNDAGKLKFEGGETLSDDALSRVRSAQKQAVQEENTAKVATTLADAGENISKAVQTANETMKGRSVGAGQAITDALEHGTEGPQEVAHIVKQQRGMYDEMANLEKDITPTLKDDRVKYVTHVPTEAGRTFFKQVGKNKAAQADLFVALEQKRIAAGLKPNAENLARGVAEQLPKDFEADILKDRAIAKNRPGATSRPVPANVRAEWEKTLGTMKPELRQFIQDNGLVKEYLDFGKDISLEHGSQIPRLKQYKGLTVTELNDVMAKAGAKGPVYNPNPAAQMLTRQIRHQKVMAGKTFLEQTAEKFGRPDANVPDIMKSLADDTISPEGFRQMMGIEDPQTAKAAYDTLKRMTDDEEMGALVDGYDKLTRAWKGWVTRGFPAYHVRNHIGNRLQAWLTGVPLAGEHVELGHKLVGGADFKVALGDGKVLDRDQLLKEAQSVGALKGGFFEDNLREALDDTKGQFDPLNPNNAIIAGAERVSAGLAGGLNQVLAGKGKNALKMDGNAIESADRASTYIWWRQKGFSPKAAAQKVDEALFDYSKENLSPFEQKYASRAMFFYGYTRQVLPFMLDSMLKNGTKVKQLTQLGIQPGRPDFVPEYAAGGLQLPLGTDAEGNSKMAYSLGTPVEAAAEPFAGNPLSMLNPILKTPLELLTGKDFFLGKDIADAKKAPNYVDNLPDSIQHLLGTVKTKTKAGGERVEIDPNIAYALRNNPFSRIGTTASKIFDERKDPSDILQNLLSGARVVSIDDEEEKKWRAKDQAKERLRDLAKEGRVKTGKFESFGRTGPGQKGKDAEVDYLLGLVNAH